MCLLEANTDPAQCKLIREEVVMDKMWDVLSVEYGGIPWFAYVETNRPKHTTWNPSVKLHPIYTHPLIMPKLSV